MLRESFYFLGVGLLLDAFIGVGRRPTRKKQRNRLGAYGTNKEETKEATYLYK